MKVLAIIPARCGSKGFKDKNIAVIENKTLIEWGIEVAKKSKYIDDIYISTDCEKYENIAIKAGAKSLGLRPSYLAEDNTKTKDVILDMLNKLPKYDIIVLLQPTSPIRTAIQIDEMIELLKDNDSIVTIQKIDEPHPYKLKKIKNGYIKSFLENTSSEIARQLLPDVYKLTGAIYVVNYEFFIQKQTWFGKTLPYIQDISVNIDSELDFIYLKALLEYKKTTLKELCNV